MKMITIFALWAQLSNFRMQHLSPTSQIKENYYKTYQSQQADNYCASLRERTLGNGKVVPTFRVNEGLCEVAEVALKKLYMNANVAHGTTRSAGED